MKKRPAVSCPGAKLRMLSDLEKDLMQAWISCVHFCFIFGNASIQEGISSDNLRGA